MTGNGNARDKARIAVPRRHVMIMETAGHRSFLGVLKCFSFFGRRCAAASRFTFFKGETLYPHATKAPDGKPSGAERAAAGPESPGGAARQNVWSNFSVKRCAFQTIRPVASRKNAVFPARFGPGGAVPPPRVSPFSKVKRSRNCSSVLQNAPWGARRPGTHRARGSLPPDSRNYGTAR